MTIDKGEFYITFIPKKSTLFNDFIKIFFTEVEKYDENNIILSFLDYKISIDELLKFTDFSTKKTELGTSFVVVKSDVDLDKIPDELIITPTLQEAIDIIDMDEMTRSLDF